MPSVCLYFQMHQPLRLRRYSVFDTEPQYFDDTLNATVLKKVAVKCYDPATKLMLDLVRRHKGLYRFSISITGLLIEQLRQHAPHVITTLQKLAQTGCVEFLNETYHHSLAFLYSRSEFLQQIDQHHAMITDLFGQSPRVFRNTELIYSNDLAQYLHETGRYHAVLAEGVDSLLAGRSPDQPFHPPHVPGMTVLLRNYRLSDDIAFRFSNSSWPGYPLTAPTYAEWVGRLPGPVVNIFLDFETFGEHQWADTGIFSFLDVLPTAMLKTNCTFRTISEAVEAHKPAAEFDAPSVVSWADTERDLSAWLGNAMQSNAMHELYKLEATVRASGDPALLSDWRRLTVSDHVYYMCTKYYADGVVHSYFNPYESPYDSYINYMNVLDNLRSRIAAAQPTRAEV
jgi:alpha-amylase